MKIYREDNLQIAFMQYAHMQYPGRLIFHCPNGGTRNPKEGLRLKKMGVLRGVSDVIVMEPKIHNDRIIHCGLVIELKIKPNTPSKEQLWFMEEARKRGWLTDICYDFYAAKKTLDEYLKS